MDKNIEIGNSQNNNSETNGIISFLLAVSSLIISISCHGADSKVGIDCNQPIDPATGAIQANATYAVVSTTCTPWVRLNFILGPWSSPSDQTLHSGKTWKETYDEIVNSFINQGIQVYGLISDQASSNPGDVLQSETSTNQAATDAWISQYVANFVDIVGHFKNRITKYESYNEPNNWNNGTAVVHAKWFAKILQDVYMAVKYDNGHDSDPSWQVTLISGPILTHDLDDGATYIASTYSYGKSDFSWDWMHDPANIGTYPLDGFGMHIYTTQGASDPAVVIPGMDSNINAFWNSIANYEGATSKQIWVSEFGWESNAVGQQGQADNLTTGFNVLKNDSRIALAIFFSLSDWPGASWGLYEFGNFAASDQKLSFDAFKNQVNCPNGTSPTNLQVTADCSGNVDFTWSNSGNGWFVDVSTDPGFSTFSNKEVTNLTSTNAPSGFSPAITFVPGTTYYWRIWNGTTHTNGNSFTVPTQLSTPTITQNGNMLTSSAANAYQWFLNNNSINGATLQNYTPAQSGNYTVTITDMNGCSATSTVFNFTTSSSQCNNIYGIHWWTNDANMDLMNGKKGWTVEIINTANGPNAINGLISSIMSEGVFTPIIRINRNWGETVPGNPSDYDQFAEDCKNIVINLYNNYGVEWFQIGNEMNLDGEYPSAGGCPASEYVACFNKVYTAVKAAVPNAKVLVGPVGPWNNQGPLTPGGGNVYYDVYYDYIVNGIGNQCDGYGMHTYGFFSEGTDNNLSMYSLNTFPNGWGFNAYQIQIKILQQYGFTQNKPIHITETNTLSHSSVPATSYTGGWMQQAFQEINNWNNNNSNYLISSLCWFVNKDDGSWSNFALQSTVGNMPQALSDFSWTTANTNYTVSTCNGSPTNLQVTADCSGNVNFIWTNSGNGWFVDVSTDPGFSTFSNKEVSNITSTNAPSGFSPAITFVPGTTYYWRIWNGTTHTDGNSFTIPGCGTSPTNLQVFIGCSGDVAFNWTNSGSGWYVDISTDSNFNFYYNKSISNQTTTTAPSGFVCDAGFAPCTPPTLSFFQPNTIYYWRIWDGINHTTGNSFTIPAQLVAPTITASGATTFCQGGNVTLDAGTGYATYSWSNGATSQTINVTSSGNYSVIVTNDNGCLANSSVTTVTVNPLPTAPTITSSGVTTFCQGGNVTLDAGTGYNTYLWSNGASSQTINVTSSGNYSVTITNGNGCLASSALTTVNVNPLPIAPIITSSGATTFCQGGSVTLDTGTGYATYSWSNGATSQTINVTNSGNYSVTVTNGNECLASSSVTNVIVHPLPLITGTPASPVICEGDSVQLTANGASTYYWTPATGLSTSTGATVIATPVNTIIYTIIGVSPLGCTNTTTITVTVNPLPTSIITQNGNMLTSSAVTGNQWYFNSTAINGATSQNYTPVQVGNYSLIVTDLNGCSASSAVFYFMTTDIESLPDSGGLQSLITIYPNPNKGKFKVQSSKFNVAGLAIFNLAGEKIYSMENEQLSIINYQLSIDLSSQPHGIYFIQVLTESKVIKKKIIVQ